MRAGLGFWGSSSFLWGNAKIYDGSFDYDTSSLITYPIDWNTPFSILIEAKVNAFAARQHVFLFGSVLGSPPKGVRVYIEPSGAVGIDLGGGTNRLNAIFDTLTAGKHNIIFTYTGSGTFAGLKYYRNGANIAGTVLVNSLTGTFVPYTNNNIFIGARETGLQKFNGLMRQLEIINRVATAGEIASASATGSFQGAGVANADYLLAVDFDKTGTVPPTTRTGTPSYTITSFGGAAYTQYLP